MYIYICVFYYDSLYIYAASHMARGSRNCLGWHLNIVGFLLHHDLRFAGNGDFDIPRSWKMWKYVEGKGTLNQPMIWYDLIWSDISWCHVVTLHLPAQQAARYWTKTCFLGSCWALEFRPSCFVLLIVLYTILREPRTQHGHALDWDSYESQKILTPNGVWRLRSMTPLYKSLSVLCAYVYIHT